MSWAGVVAAGHTACCVNAMKPWHCYFVRLRNRIRQMQAALRHDSGKPTATDMQQEVCVGAVIGCSTCIAVTWSFPPVIVAAAAMIGLSAGATIGLLLWSASLDLPDEGIVAPAPSEQRPAPADGQPLWTIKRACKTYRPSRLCSTCPRQEECAGDYARRINYLADTRRSPRRNAQALRTPHRIGQRKRHLLGDEGR